MTRLLIIYHSQSGNTEEMAKAVSEAASSAGATVTLKKAFDAASDDLLSCDAVAFGTPNYFGYMAGSIKDFFDRNYYTLRNKVDDKPCAVFGSAGAGGRQALDIVQRLCNSLRLIKTCEGVVARGKPSPDVLEQCKELGKKLAGS